MNKKLFKNEYILTASDMSISTKIYPYYSEEELRRMTDDDIMNKLTFLKKGNNKFGVDVKSLNDEMQELKKELEKRANKKSKQDQKERGINMSEEINKKEQAYIYEFFGDFWVNKRNYLIEVGMPTKYKTVKEAKGDNSSLRFEKHEEHIVLVIYSKWEQGMINGKWHENVAGEVLEIIKWEDWNSYKISMAKGEGVEGVGDIDSGYVPSATNWDELFDVKNKEDTWGCTVESIAYSICAYFN